MPTAPGFPSNATSMPMDILPECGEDFAADQKHSMTKGIRRMHSPAFKAKVALAAVKRGEDPYRILESWSPGQTRSGLD